MNLIKGVKSPAVSIISLTRLIMSLRPVGVHVGSPEVLNQSVVTQSILIIF